MAITTDIKFARVLQGFLDDEIYLSQSGTGSPENAISQIFYTNGVDTSLQVLSGYTAGLTAQGCNLSPSNPVFTADASWFDIVTLTAEYTDLININVRFIRIKGAADLTSNFKCFIFNEDCGMRVS